MARLSDITWVATIKYKNYPDAELYLSAVDYPDILSALAHVLRHVKDRWPYEVTAIRQQRR